MTLKERICADFIVAFKAGKKELKNTLGMLKSLITEGEKKEGTELTDAQVLAIVQGYDKNLDKSIDAMSKTDTVGLFLQATLAEKEFIKPYLPLQLSTDEMISIIESLGKLDNTNKNKTIGTVMNHFKTNCAGRYNAGILKSVIDELLA